MASGTQSILSKNAIERVENTKSLGFLQLIVSSCQAPTKLRPVIDLSRLNAFLVVEVQDGNRACMVPGFWVSSIDLYTYLHIPIQPT